MSTELLKEPDGGVLVDFHVKLQSDTEPQPSDPGKSLVQEIELLRHQVQQLCAAVRGLVHLQAIANQKLDAAITGQPFFEVGK
jgi:hypothetical protein